MLLHARLDAIPDVIEVDISELEVGESIRVDEIELPAGVRPAGDPEAAVAVGVITRSTMEAMRLERQAEEGGGEEGDEAGAAGDGGDAESADDGD